MKRTDFLSGLPGEALVREGLADYQAGQRSIAACLVEIAGPRLRQVGLVASAPSGLLPDAELRLYGILRQQGGDAYSRYGALLRELVSFEQALDRRFRAAADS